MSISSLIFIAATSPRRQRLSEDSEQLLKLVLCLTPHPLLQDLGQELMGPGQSLAPDDLNPLSHRDPAAGLLIEGQRVLDVKAISVENSLRKAPLHQRQPLLVPITLVPSNRHGWQTARHVQQALDKIGHVCRGRQSVRHALPTYLKLRRCRGGGPFPS